ncbi:transformation/transcription domain-associated protein-like [Hibiscus syriacus]|uniref:Transformation/transcription domain-associated protein-like n=1 Tax=Hibiscus syriacus TaxID=106335 RepID=A0A6A3ATY0_HIBSY|nr:uncharacterized protein LOC120121603 [Hibiscus syriacus]KAE8707756.1 transformation/transcription domain-associated protein-like [Hibiscus syriacus]
METPSSARRVTRSQTSAALNNSITVSRNNEESGKKSASKTRTRNGKQQQEDRSALIDITNDSPIVGLAFGTPKSDISKPWGGKNTRMMTLGSGEALLRGQVKNLLQKVEEEAKLSKVTLDNRRPFLHLQSCVNSPMGILAPTPANTPQVEDGINNTGVMMALPVFEEKLRISEVMTSGIFEGLSVESQKSMITRSLLLDFSEKSETSDSTECDSVVTNEGVIKGESYASKEKASIDDDNSSVWSMQVNTSTHGEDEETIEEMGDDYYEEEEETMGDDGGLLVDELCEGLSKMSMKEKFKGKHTRFVYNSDDELEEECVEDSSEIMRLKGLPTPKGKHLRFPMDDDE